MDTSKSGANHAVLHAQNHRWGLGPIETYNLSSKVAVFNTQNHRWGLEPIETCNSVPKGAVIHAQSDRWGLACKNLRCGQGTIETSNSSAKVAVCMHKTTGEGWNPDRLFNLVQSTLLCVLKTTDEVWDPHTLVSLVLKSLFCIQKPQMRAGTHRD